MIQSLLTNYGSRILAVCVVIINIIWCAYHLQRIRLMQLQINTLYADIAKLFNNQTTPRLRQTRKSSPKGVRKPDSIDSLPPEIKNDC